MTRIDVKSKSVLYLFIFYFENSTICTYILCGTISRTLITFIYLHKKRLKAQVLFSDAVKVLNHVQRMNPYIYGVY